MELSRTSLFAEYFTWVFHRNIAIIRHGQDVIAILGKHARIEFLHHVL
jgi:hypothetical protein